MKVGVYLVNDFSPSVGGNFSFYEKIIQTIDSYQFDKKLEICFVGRRPRRKMDLSREYIVLTPYVIYKFFRTLEKLGIVQLLSKALFTNADLCNIWDQSVLKRNGVDILLFPKQFLREIKNFPFITMNWDAGHKSTFAFPELLQNFEFREHWYRVEIQKAIAIFVESQSSKEEFTHYYSIPENKIEVIPLFAGGVIDLKVDDQRQREILQELSLEKCSYLYYPAQFWAHKNHYILILALKKLTAENNSSKIKLVFSGSDMGNKNYILSLIKENALTQQVIVLGFISNEKVYTLYKNAIALVVPSYLGPTSMPILEAQSLQTAILCSDLNGHKEICGDGALYIPPGDSEKWRDGILAILNNDFRLELIKKADQVKNGSIFNIQSSIRKLEAALIKFIPVRKTFF